MSGRSAKMRFSFGCSARQAPHQRAKKWTTTSASPAVESSFNRAAVDDTLLWPGASSSVHQPDAVDASSTLPPDLTALSAREETGEEERRGEKETGDAGRGPTAGPSLHLCVARSFCAAPPPRLEAAEAASAASAGGGGTAAPRLSLPSPPRALVAVAQASIALPQPQHDCCYVRGACTLSVLASRPRQRRRRRVDCGWQPASQEPATHGLAAITPAVHRLAVLRRVARSPLCSSVLRLLGLTQPAQRMQLAKRHTTRLCRRGFATGVEGGGALAARVARKG